MADDLLYGYPLDGQIIAINTQAAYDATHDSVKGGWVVVPPGTVFGATQNSEGAWVNPPPQPVVYPDIFPGVFYTCFTPQERIDIKAATDPLIEEFWATYQVAKDTATPINPNVVSVIEGLEYLTTIDVPSANPPRKYLAPQRVQQIQAGAVQ